MLDDKGSIYIIDALLALVLVLAALMIVNMTISISTPDYSYDLKEFKSSQDTMELLSGKIDFDDKTFLGEISDILKDGENSKESVRKVSTLCKNKLNSYNLKNYRFCENNVLKGEVLASSGDITKASNISKATRNYDDYSYTLSVW